MKESCPLCAQTNHCTANVSTCWCIKITLSDKVKERLKVLNVEAGCVCNACLQQLEREN